MPSREIMEMRNYFETGITREYAFRADQLRLLRQAVKNRESELLDCLNRDLGKPAFEGYAAEIGLLYREIGFAEKHLKRWMKPRRAGTGLVNFPARGKILSEPKGVALIFSPWNYPVQLSLMPLVAALAAGNCAYLTLSERSPATSACLARLIGDSFDSRCVAASVGGTAFNQALLKEKFDHIFFTGSTRVGRLVYQAAAKNLTPVTLELGGKSPVIVDHTADLRSAARRIVWGKCLNAGQTCAAPDYLLAERSVKDALIEELKHAHLSLYPEGGGSADYGRLIDEAAFDRLAALTEGQNILYRGGTPDRENRKFPFTLLEPERDAPVMEEEIFGPILPVLTFDSLSEAEREIAARPQPLALYLFSKDRSTLRRLEKIPFGGGCVGDTVSHLVSESLPFGGVGLSGMGSYHGKRGFEEFSHFKSILIRPEAEIGLRYPPYRREKLLRRFLKP